MQAALILFLKCCIAGFFAYMAGAWFDKSFLQYPTSAIIGLFAVKTIELYYSIFTT